MSSAYTRQSTAARAPHNQIRVRRRFLLLDQLQTHGAEPVGGDGHQSKPSFIYRATSCIEPTRTL